MLYEVITHWLEVTPEGFCFSLKAHRSITHLRRLDHAGDVLHAFMHQIAPLRPKLGVILFQLPSSRERDLPMLEAFLVITSYSIHYTKLYEGVFLLVESSVF